MSRSKPYACVEEIICELLNVSFSNLDVKKNLVTAKEKIDGKEKTVSKIEDVYTFDIKLIGNNTSYEFDNTALTAEQYEFILNYLKSKETPQPNGDNNNG